MALALCLFGAQGMSRAAQAGPLVSSPVGSTVAAPSPSGPAAGPESASVEQGYASREASAKSLESFKGGDVVIIGSTGLVIILLVILIIVLV